MGSIPFKQAARYQVASRVKGDVKWIVLHDAETPEAVNTAQAIADYFASGSGGRDASAHYSVDGGPHDGNEVVQSVYEKDVAYGAGSANRNGIHIEQAGRGAQTRAEWLDAYGLTMLPRVAQLIREIAGRWNIPLVFVDAAGLKAGHAGITTHAQVSIAYPSTGHTDPGPNYPIDKLFEYINGSTQEEPWMALTDVGKQRFENLFNSTDRYNRLMALLDSQDELSTMAGEWAAHRDAAPAAGGGATPAQVEAALKKVNKQAWNA